VGRRWQQVAACPVDPVSRPRQAAPSGGPVTRRRARRWIALSVARARHGAGLRDGPQNE
jgi:hypothetical protein